MAFENVTHRLINAPGLYDADRIRAAANEIEAFLGLFNDMEEIMGKGAVNPGMLAHHVRNLRATAEIVERR